MILFAFVETKSLLESVSSNYNILAHYPFVTNSDHNAKNVNKEPQANLYWLRICTKLSTLVLLRDMNPGMMVKLEKAARMYVLLRTQLSMHKPGSRINVNVEPSRVMFSQWIGYSVVRLFDIVLDLIMIQSLKKNSDS